MRASLILGGMLLVAACSRDTSPPAPVAPSAVVAPPPIQSVVSWTLTGQIIDTITRQPVVGVRLLPFAVLTTTNGVFRIDGTGERNAERVTLEKTGYITRETTISRTTQNPILDLIGDSDGTFSIDFYRQLVRNGYEDPKNLEPLRRWTSAPQIYIDTTTPANLTLLDTDIQRIDETIRRAVPLFTGGRFHVATVMRGTAPPSGPGWIVVDFTREAKGQYCARADVGTNPGRMSFNYNRCTCGSRRILPEIVTHELGHAMGFWHTETGVMRAIGYACTDRWPTAEEQAHAAVAYTRSPGNTDPDVDPMGAAFLSALPTRVVID